MQGSKAGGWEGSAGKARLRERQSRGERVGAGGWQCARGRVSSHGAGFHPRLGGASVTPEAALQGERVAQTKAVSRNDAAFPKNG